MSEDRKPCAGCGVEVWWVRHERTGNPAPLVKPPDEMKANIAVYRDDGQPVYHIKRKNESFAFSETPLEYINHFSDCPKAADFKRKPNVSK